MNDRRKCGFWSGNFFSNMVSCFLFFWRVRHVATVTDQIPHLFFLWILVRRRLDQSFAWIVNLSEPIHFNFNFPPFLMIALVFIVQVSGHINSVPDAFTVSFIPRMLVNTLNHCSIGLWVHGANFNEAREVFTFDAITVEVSQIVAIIMSPHVVTIHQSTKMLVVFQNRNEIKMRVRNLPPVLMVSFSALNHREAKKASGWVLVINQLFSH